MSYYKEFEIKQNKELIWNNMQTLFNLKNTMSKKTIINKQKKFINKYILCGKNKYNTLTILNNYFNHPNKDLAEQIYFNTLNKKKY
tara:strand:- start:307 stop:564 length:258 start_codon:yes stop_codon:yes gene_type:complete